jgi:hypothetical protein
MELTTEQFAEITGFCVISPAADARADRRKHSRVPFGSRARISSLQAGLDGIDSVVVIRDISASGLSLLSSGAMEPGEQFVIQFSGEHGWPARILCQAARCEPGGSGGAQFIIGAGFEMVIESAGVGAGVAGHTHTEAHPDGVCPTCGRGEAPALAAETPRQSRATLPRRVHQFLQHAVKAAYMGLFGAGAYDGF